MRAFCGAEGVAISVSNPIGFETELPKAISFYKGKYTFKKQL